MTQPSACIELRQRAHDVITAETARTLPLETGGILLGYVEDSNVVVTDALAVDGGRATNNRYVRDDVLANKLLLEFLKNRASDDPTGYIGEWHSHPAAAGPSPMDLDALRTIARTGTRAVALVVYATSHATPFHGVIARRPRLGRVTTTVAPINLPKSRFQPLGPLPPGAVRGDGPVFISYRQSDGTPQAESLEHLLRAAGLVVWRDYRDLRPGTTTERLEQALTQGLSAAVLVVTPDIVDSEIVRERELPRLLQLDEDPAFSLCIANKIARAGATSNCDYEAPDRLLRLAPQRTLADKKQSNMLVAGGEVEIARDLLMHRIEQRKSLLRSENRALTVRVQSRPTSFAVDADDEDLHVRVMPAEQGRLPSRAGLRLLQTTLPLIGDAVYAARAAAIRISGGTHLSIALAIGAALPETKFGTVEVLDTRNEIWSSASRNDDQLRSDLRMGAVDVTPTQIGAPPARIAIFVSLTPGADQNAFERLVRESNGGFHTATTITTGDKRLDPREAGRLSETIAQEIKLLAAENGRAEVHLAYHGPFTMAVLIGRYLNTLRTVVYEWEDEIGEGARYVPSLVLDSGTARGPITEVLLPP